MISIFSKLANEDMYLGPREHVLCDQDAGGSLFRYCVYFVFKLHSDEM